MAETIAVLSLKGGTGKTTTVRTLADVLRRVGLSVLAIDLDPQGNLSDYFDIAPDAAPTTRDVLLGQAEADAAVHESPDGVRLLDDRSLNGVFVNEERVEWRTLCDGDEVLVGCHSLRYVEVVAEGGASTSGPHRRRQLTT